MRLTSHFRAPHDPHRMSATTAQPLLEIRDLRIESARRGELRAFPLEGYRSTSSGASSSLLSASPAAARRRPRARSLVCCRQVFAARAAASSSTAAILRPLDTPRSARAAWRRRWHGVPGADGLAQSGRSPSGGRWRRGSACTRLGKHEIRERCLDMLARVQIRDPERTRSSPIRTNSPAACASASCWPRSCC